jgi:hypothetical protein
MVDHTTSGDDATKSDLAGFVAMEYFALILNRTFVVFIAPDGLYGWKAIGTIAAGAPLYFQEYAQMLEDPKLMHDLTAIRKLARLKGGFFIPRSEIASVEIVSKQKPGMGAFLIREEFLFTCLQIVSANLSFSEELTPSEFSD